MKGKQMKIVQRWELPISGEGCHNATFFFDGVDTQLDYIYIDIEDDEKSVERRKKGRIVFKSSCHFRSYSEVFSDRFVNYKGSYDALVEILGSDLDKEFKKRSKKYYQGRDPHRRFRHIAVFLSNVGLFEVVADDFEILEPEYIDD